MTRRAEERERLACREDRQDRDRDRQGNAAEGDDDDEERDEDGGAGRALAHPDLPPETALAARELEQGLVECGRPSPATAPRRNRAPRRPTAR